MKNQLQDQDIEEYIKSIYIEINTSLEKSNEKIMNFQLMKKLNNQSNITYDIVEVYLNEVISQQNKLLKGCLILLNSIDIAKKNNLNDIELREFYENIFKELGLLVYL